MAVVGEIFRRLAAAVKEKKELLLGYFGDGCRRVEVFFFLLSFFFRGSLRVEGVFQESLGEKHFSSESLEGKNGKRASPAS